MTEQRWVLIGILGVSFATIAWDGQTFEQRLAYPPSSGPEQNTKASSPRFYMMKDGKVQTAEDFDQWLLARGLTIKKGPQTQTPLPGDDKETSLQNQILPKNEGHTKDANAFWRETGIIVPFDEETKPR